VIKALITLGGLPARESSNEQIDKALYYLALKGVTRYGLAEAIKAVAQNKLGHPFFPAPQELRGLCDKAMEWHEMEADRIRRRERENAEFARQSGGFQPQTPEARERVAALYRKFLSQGGHDEDGDEQSFRDAMYAKYGKEALDAIPDNPNASKPPKGWVRP
jgi:hypothetical protein